MLLAGRPCANLPPIWPIPFLGRKDTGFLADATWLKQRTQAHALHLLLSLPNLSPRHSACAVAAWRCRLQAEPPRFLGWDQDGIMPLAPLGKVRYDRGVVLDEKKRVAARHQSPDLFIGQKDMLEDNDGAVLGYGFRQTGKHAGLKALHVDFHHLGSRQPHFAPDSIPAANLDFDLPTLLEIS